MHPNNKFTAIVRDTTFQLSRSQIEFDSPNFFTACFMGDFKEAQSRTVEVMRDPDLFRIIMNYLCGYTVLPLTGTAVPTTMTPATALINLRVDAEYYQLNGLVRACDEYAATRSTSPDKYRILAGCTNLQQNVADYSHFIRMFTDFADMRVPQENLQVTLSNLKTPVSCIGFDALRELNSIELVVTKALGQYDKTKWRLIGWNVKRSVTSELLIVLEDLTLA